MFGAETLRKRAERLCEELEERIRRARETDAAAGRDRRRKARAAARK
jgi:hypothetical protein